ncbi:MAG TPA: hypothetical protein DDX29_07305 [Clostridiales bacterium]|nr:hypothetical protein [Clostridiales bacterium]
MKKLMISILCITLIFSTACRKQDPVTTTASFTESEPSQGLVVDESYLASTGSAYLESLFSGEYEKAYTVYLHDEAMTNAINPESYKAFFDDMYSKYGAFEKFVGAETRFQGDYGFYTTGVILETTSLNANVVFDKDGLIAGFNFTPFTFDDGIETEKPTSFLEIDVEFGLEDWLLTGKITIPSNDGENPLPGKHPVLVLVHGSGPNDMNETVGLNEPFKDIAHYMAERGISVLRYDKRTFTYGAQMAMLKDLTVYEETIDDAAEAVEFVSTLDYIDSDRIFVLGHSLGGYLIPRIAEVTPKARGYIIAAGIFSSLGQVIPQQISYLSMVDGEISKEEQEYIDEMSLQAEKSLNPDSIGEDEVVIGAYKTYWVDLANYDSVAMARQIEKPVYVFQGDRDYQVPVSEFEIINDAVNDKDNYTLQIWSDMNHLMFLGEGTPTPEEYFVKNEVYPPLLDYIINFIIK